MAKVDKPLSPAIFPVPVVLVSCADEQGRPNIITLAWAGNVCSDPPMVAISIRPSRYSHGLVAATKEFVVNIPTEGMVRQVDVCGTVSGRDEDKWVACGFTPEGSSKVKAPAIKECPVNIECVVREVVSLGTHDMFVGEVVAIREDEGYFGERDRLDVSKVRPIAYAREEYWGLSEKIGLYGFSKKA